MGELLLSKTGLTTRVAFHRPDQDEGTGLTGLLPLHHRFGVLMME
ncbi:hypothetical protein [Arthrobacter sp. W4I7]|nr:hypothetical protein [Arthrobacter sp. W4I7]MDQ0692995.1 hypothetical protein [Arthrobacter sp. W4I7]